MNDRTFNFLMSILIFTPVYLFLYWISYLVFPSFDGVAKACLLGAMTAILAPRFERYEVMGEKRTKLNWIFRH